MSEHNPFKQKRGGGRGGARFKSGDWNAHEHTGERKGRGSGRGERGRGRGGRGRGQGNSENKRDGNEYKQRGNGENQSSRRGEGSNDNRASRPIGYQLLKSWSESEDAEELLIHISNKIECLEKLLAGDSMKPDWFTLMVNSFTKAFKCQHQTQKLKKLLLLIIKSNFLNLLLTNYLEEKELEGVNWVQAEDFFQSIIEIIKQITKHLPDQSQRCKITLNFLKSSVQDMCWLSNNDHLEGMINSVLKSVSEARMNQIQKESAKKFPRPTADNETPPEDFRELSIVPTVNDLFAKGKPFLRAIIVKGVYRDQEHYLDVQFRLMREDFFKPLRLGIQDLCDSKNKLYSSDLRIYQDVHFTGIALANGLSHVVQFDVKKMKNVKWDHSKRLLPGNLLCLSNDSFKKTLIFATVSFRKSEQLKKGMLNVTIHSGLDIVLKTTSNDTFVMAETTAYYEAVYPILKGLQTIDSDLPLKDYIILCKKNLKPPSYLLGAVRKYDIGCLMKTSRSMEVSVLNTKLWPNSEDMCLNPSQRDAVILALTKELSVIQGPPGTGKTYVGLKVMETLLRNQEQRAANEYGEDIDPILVICFTNHALDQFLEGILQFCTDGIIRVGGRSSSNILEPFNLSTVKRKLGNQSKAFRFSIHQLYRTMDDYASEISKFKRLLENTSNDILDEDTLSDCISRKHYQELVKGFSNGGRGKRSSKMSEWLNASSSSFVHDLPIMIKQHTTRLVMIFINLCSKVDKFNFHNFTFNLKGNILERVQTYSSWLFNYRRSLRARLSSMAIDPATGNGILSLAYRPSILRDNEISSAIPYRLLDQVMSYLSLFDLESVEEDHYIESWVLGVHNSLKKQLDEFEELSNYLDKTTNKNLDQEDDDFDDDEEIKMSKVHRMLFDDDVDEKKFQEANLVLETDHGFLVNRAKLLGITEDISNEEDEKNYEDGDGFKTVNRKKQISTAKVIKLLADETCLPLDEEKEDAITDIWELDNKTRFALYKLWVKKYRDTLVEKIEHLLKQYNDTKEELKETRMKEDVDVLKQAKVIGMTTTGAAKHRAWLEAIGARIIIVEEAAEVLESHIVTALNQNCKHLILIGDHQQLKPNPTVYEHARDYKLDVSLFERLVNNDIPHVTLHEQHRMRESISVIMRHIYPNLQDHMSVKKYENIRGVSKNIFFIQHNNLESSVSDSSSKSNLFEAEFLIKLCKYFLLQGYEPSQISILATYAGQVLELKKHMTKASLQRGVRITAVDNFQGEENDIILLSLVRSNMRNDAGFLKVDNRVCVALSRAKKGLFAIGNIDLLATQSKLWENIKQTAIQEEIIGEGIPVHCPNHPNDKNFMRLPSDFDKRPQGGCNKKCDFRLECGHICRLDCHGYNPLHKDLKCLSPCSKTCAKGHPCRDKCWQVCGSCKFLVDKVIPVCGHTNKFACHMTPRDTDCYSQCQNYLECGHQCQGKCGECKKSGHKRCGELVTYFWPCNHEMEVPCYMKPDKYPCPKECSHRLQCGHICKGKCSDCLNGGIHIACTERCGRALPCGHHCQSYCGVICPPCSLPCPVRCLHGPCSHTNKTRTCGEPCIPCKEKCIIFKKCKHQKCDLKCSEICEEPCGKECENTVNPCGHSCASLCGESCVCRHCDEVLTCPKTNTMNKEASGHIDVFDKKNRKENVIERKGEDFIPSSDTKANDLKCQHQEIKSSNQISNGGKSKEEKEKGPNPTEPESSQYSILIKLPACGHVFVMKEIDEYINLFKISTTEIIKCPECSTPIQMTPHFDKVLKERAKLREMKKFEIYQSNDITDTRKNMMCQSLKALQDGDQRLVWFEWRNLKDERVTNLSEFEAISCKLKFAYVINEIQSFEQVVMSEIDKQLENRVASLLKIRKHMSYQQIEEYRVDLKRLFIVKYVKSLENFACNHGIKEFEKEKKKNILDSLKVTKPKQTVIRQGIAFIKEMEAAIDEEFPSSTVEAVLLIKKRIARRILNVLNAENTKMLSEILNSSLPSYSSGTNLFLSKGSKVASSSASKTSFGGISKGSKVASSSASNASSHGGISKVESPPDSKTSSSSIQNYASSTSDGNAKDEKQNRLSRFLSKLHKFV